MNTCIRFIIFITIIIIAFEFTNAQEESIVFTSSNLPIFVINTNGQVIVDEPKKVVDLGIIYNGDGLRNNISDPFNHYDGKIAIEIRGSSSQMFPKKQYGFETIDSTGEDLDISLLGLPGESDWILYAPYSDKSLIRDILVYKLSNTIDRYASRTKLCELVLNDEYMGVYVLLEKIKRDNNRVDISHLDESDTTGDNLTGGYILKIDKTEGGFHDGWNSQFSPFPNAWQRIYFQYHYPKPEAIVEVQKNYIKSFIDSFETRMYSSDFADTMNGYSKFIDVNTFVDFFILNELTKNVDAYRLSSYLYKDRDSEDGKLKVGPIWDFNLGFGNCNYYSASTIAGWQLDYDTSDPSFLNSDNYQVPFWWSKLFSDTCFNRKVALRWNGLREDLFSTPAIISIIDSLVGLLDESQERNFERWTILNQYVWPNAYIGETYSNEIDYLKNWITQRFNWMDKELDLIDDVNETGNEQLSGFMLYQNYPNPFNPTTKIKYSILNVGASLMKPVQLKVYDVLGKEVAALVNEQKPAGIYEVEFNATGLSSGFYFYKLTAGNLVETKKMLLLR